MMDAYESAEFARRKPMSARAKQAISRALKGKFRTKKQSMSRKKKAGMALGAAAGLGALALGGRAIMKRNQGPRRLSRYIDAPRAPKRYSEDRTLTGQ